MKTIILKRPEMIGAREKGLSAKEFVCEAFKKKYDLNFNPHEIVNSKMFFFEELVDGSGYKVSYLEGLT